MSTKRHCKHDQDSKMMGAENRIQCYRRIIEQVKSSGEVGISKMDLLSLLIKEDLVFTKYTLQRRMREIHNILDIGLYDPNLKRYILYKEDLRDVDNFLVFLERNTFILANNSKLPMSRSTFNCFSFESHERFQGMEHVQKLVDAITHHKKISFWFKRYEPKAKPQSVFLCPILLKEYQGRWYICGYEDIEGPVRHFCLDRVTKLSVNLEEFEPVRVGHEDPFQNVLGITIKKPKHIELRFSHYQAQYIKALPWHTSQKIILEENHFVTFSYELAENYELVQRILMYGSEIKVLKPKSLVNWVKGILGRTVLNYD